MKSRLLKEEERILLRQTNLKDQKRADRKVAIKRLRYQMVPTISKWDYWETKGARSLKVYYDHKLFNSSNNHK